jgi:hypothetical protein
MRFGAWCALFALAVQFTISFGHVHAPENIAAAGDLPLSALSDQGHAAAVPDAPAVPAKPAGLPFDYCAICAVTNLAGNAMPAVAPTLPVAAVFHPVRFWPDVDAAATAAPYRLFKARDPPQA